MLVKIDVFDAKSDSRGVCHLGLDWRSKTWAVTSNPYRIWERISLSLHGAFELESAGPLWLRDSLRKGMVVFYNAPRSGEDVSRISGEGYISDPQDRTFKGGKIRWTAEPTGDPSDSAKPPVLSPRRVQLLKRLKELLPCTYGSKNYDILTGAAKRGATRTNCYMLPGFVTYELGTQGMTPAAKDRYMQQRSLNGMSQIRTRGSQYNDSWFTADRVHRPQPGDIYGLLYWEKTDLSGDFSHVGVIESAEGTEWRTADFGQGSGWDGVRDFVRVYDPGAGTLTGAGTRVLAGWVDIDKYFA